MIEIQKGVQKSAPPNLIYPFRDMVPGDSFFMKPVGQQDMESLRTNIHHAARYQLGGSGKVETRVVVENGVTGIRTWRKGVKEDPQIGMMLDEIFAKHFPDGGFQ
jgi:hypothetical protein